MHPIENELQQLVEAGFPGAFVYIEDRDGSSQFYTAGFADLEARRRMTPHDQYRIGSTTKTFTAIVTLQLVAEGKLALDDTLDKLLPDIPVTYAHSLTVEHLLRMRSGLFDFEDDPELAGNLEAHLVPVSLQRAVNLGVRHTPIFAPGTRFTYCNTNFCLLEMIIERVTRHSLAHEFEQRIFEPLNLADTTYPDENDLSLPEPYIRGYERTREGWRECSQVFFGRGDGAIISTAADLGRFFRALIVEQKLLPAELMRQMMDVIPDDPPAEEAYGLGLMPETLPCGTLWGHAGGGYGYGNLPQILLETDRFAVFMHNGSYGFHAPNDPSIASPPRVSPEFRSLIYC